MSLSYEKLTNQYEWYNIIILKNYRFEISTSLSLNKSVESRMFLIGHQER